MISVFINNESIQIIFYANTIEIYLAQCYILRIAANP